MTQETDGVLRTGWKGVFTVPNFVSLIRLGCIPVFVWMLFGVEERIGAALLLGFLGATDWIDGWLARRMNQISELGKILDPTADRLLLLVAVPCLIIDRSIPLWFALLVLIRELLVGLAFLCLAALGVRSVEVSWWGKTGTFALLCAVPCFLAAESKAFAETLFLIMAWGFGLPGLFISWVAAFRYMPSAYKDLIMSKK
tara:strand:+ start:519 stop:1115 length:597 start_codon:yes stop_codon:yes gene_type:complete